MKPHRKHRIAPINNVTVPFRVEQQVIQDNCNAILERDQQFSNNYRTLRDKFTSGVMKAGQFKEILRWQVSACLRRANVPLRSARIYEQLAGCPSQSPDMSPSNWTPLHP